jgi:hypothetical protein
MATKKKTKKSKSKPKKAPKKLKKKSVAKKITRPKKSLPKKKTASKPLAKSGRAQNVGPIRFELKGRGAGSGGQSGDLQGLSNSAGADSESVDELLEEGNAFEAEVVEGVENAPDADEGEVHTHEVSEDDVPDEYLDQDK